MHDFYAPAASGPLDQADGLRRLFGGRRRHVLPLVANPHVVFSGLVLDRLAAVFAASGREVLVVDAGALSPPPHELARVDLGACVERLSPRVCYLPARGLPKLHIDTRGSAGGFIDAVQCAAPQAEIVLLHAEGQDLARIFRRRAARPLLIGADHPESIKHAYANLKLLARRCELMTFDLLLTASRLSPRAGSIGASLAECADRFLGATLLHTALIDPAGDLDQAPDEDLSEMLAAQLALDDSLPLPPAEAGFRPPRPAPLNQNRPAHP